MRMSGSWVLLHVHARGVLRRSGSVRGGRRSSWSRGGRGQGVPQCQSHGHYFLLLVDDNLLGDASQLLVVALA